MVYLKQIFPVYGRSIKLLPYRLQILTPFLFVIIKPSLFEKNCLLFQTMYKYHLFVFMKLSSTILRNP